MALPSACRPQPGPLRALLIAVALSAVAGCLACSPAASSAGRPSAAPADPVASVTVPASAGSRRPTPADVAGPDGACPPLQNSVAPATGILLGAAVNPDGDSLAAYGKRLGHAPAVAVVFAGLPMSHGDRLAVDALVAQARRLGSSVLLTMEPRQGLGAVTAPVARELATQLRGYNTTGVPVVVRFGHEMNGSWYPWGQDPAAFRTAFRRVAAAVHADAPGSAMMWAPSYGGGYPFSGGSYYAGAQTTRGRQLDSNHDGRLSEADDPYAPYWPGRASVDWVGLSVYHWGNRYKWGSNEVPEAGKFVGQLRGTYHGLGGDQRDVPDFYARYGERKGLPVAVAETAALSIAGRGGAAELSIKRAWWRQTLAPDLSRRLPLLKMVNWFEWDKTEPEVQARVSWSATGSAASARAYREALPDWARWAGGRPRC
ncbi:MAG: hypothetical protein JWP61_1564 [Friedmanniella sp.]|nr:hypothetical protein [Friedmanniella sp.]